MKGKKNSQFSLAEMFAILLKKRALLLFMLLGLLIIYLFAHLKTVNKDKYDLEFF